MTKINLKSLYGDNAQYSDENSTTALEQIDEAYLPALNEALEDFQSGADLQLGCDCSVAVTHETLADFDAARANHWNGRGARDDVEVGGCKARRFKNFQLFEGQPRRSGMIVIQLGDICATIY